MTDTWDAGTTRIATAADQPKHLVKMTSLDSFIAENGLTRLDFVKVDIEGAEHRFLDGAAASLKRYRRILMIEIQEATLEAFGSSTRALMQRIDELGYAIFRSSRTGLVPLVTALPRGHFLNGIAIPKESCPVGPLGWADLAWIAEQRSPSTAVYLFSAPCGDPCKRAQSIGARGPGRVVAISVSVPARLMKARGNALRR